MHYMGNRVPFEIQSLSGPLRAAAAQSFQFIYILLPPFECPGPKSPLEVGALETDTASFSPPHPAGLPWQWSLMVIDRDRGVYVQTRDVALGDC